VRVSTDGHTHTQTNAKRFYYLSHAICYSYGADNNTYAHDEQGANPGQVREIDAFDGVLYKL